LKRIAQQAKANASARAERKVNETINKAIDSMVKKPAKKEKDNSNPELINNPNKNTIGAKKDPIENKNDTGMAPQNGYIQAAIFPDKTLVGAAITITGPSMFGKIWRRMIRLSFNPSAFAACTYSISLMAIIIVPPKNSTEKTATFQTAINKNDGSFKLSFDNTNTEGAYNVKVNSPDGKASKNLSFTIYDFDGLDNIGENIKDLMEEALKALKTIVAKIKEQAANKDDKEIDEKMKEVEENIQ